MTIIYHVFTVNDWEEIFEEQMFRLYDSGLLKDARLHIFVSGDLNAVRAKFVNLRSQKIKHCAHEYHHSTGEPDTLRQAQELIPKDGVTLYLHAKGVTRKEKANIRDWRKFMEYYVIDHWEECVESLITHDAAGVNYWSDHPRPHFSGNFWWANNRYLKSLEVPKEDRLEAEFWIGTGSPKVKCFKALGEACYGTPCPESLYRTKLSVLICLSRYDQASELIKELEKQSKGQPVEILCTYDNKKRSIGKKRQDLLNMALGEYITFVDDDDWVKPGYINIILEGIQRNPDVFNFGVDYYDNGEFIQTVRYNKDFERDWNIPGMFLRIPNHISVVRKDIALKVGFLPMSWQEDVAYSKGLLPHLRVQEGTKRVLYDYLHRTKGFKFSVVILSNSKSELHRQVTEFCLESLLSDKTELVYDIVVLEANPDISWNNYKGVRTIYQVGEFNYNRYMNLGASLTTGHVIAFCNNDLQFTDGWAERILSWMGKIGLDSASPVCRVRFPKAFYTAPVIVGNQPGMMVAGHCIVMTRKYFNYIGGFDTDVNFWCSENSYVEQLERTGGRHGLITTSVVNHLGGRSKGFTLRDSEKYDELTMAQVDVYNQKYNRNLFGRNDTK